MHNSFSARVIFLAILTDLVALVIFCILWTPFNPRELFRPIPAGAVFVSSHRDAPSRYEALATNVFFKSLFSGKELPNHLPGGNRTAALLFGRQTVCAYVPSLGQSACPAMVIASWTGAWAPVIRWALWFHVPKEIVQTGENNGRRLWMIRKPFPAFGADTSASFFSFAFDEGVFIGCLSEDQDGIAALLQVYDGRSDSILKVKEFSLREPAPEMDRMWMRVESGHAARRPQTFYATCSIDFLKDDCLLATLRFEPGIFRIKGASVTNAFEGLGRLYGCRPDFLAKLTSDLIAGLLDSFADPGWAGSLAPILVRPSGSNNASFLMVFNGDYGGHLGKDPFRIPMPTILLVAPASQRRAKDAISELLDLLNAKYRLGLIINSAVEPAGKCPVFALESTSAGDFNSLPVDDRPAFAFHNGWLLLASNCAGLRPILMSLQAESGPGEGASNEWMRRALNRRAEAFVWFDPDMGGRAVRLALTTAIAMTAREDRARRNQSTVRLLKTTRNWLESISSLKNCCIWLEAEHGRTVARVEIGCRKEPNFRQRQK